MLTATAIADLGTEPIPFEFFEGLYFQDKFIFAGKTGNNLSNARNLWTYDSASGQYTIYGDDVPQAHANLTFNASELTLLGNYVYFRADSMSGSQLWRFDPSANNGEGTIALVEDFGDPSIDSNPSHLTPFDGKLYFQAFTPVTGTELWAFDPAAIGTPDQSKLVADIRPNIGSSSPSHLTVLDGKLYFQANDGQSGAELWVYDPQANNGAGQVAMAADIVSGAGGSSPQGLTAFNGKLYFQATTQDFGAELWEFDPAANNGAGGAFILSDIYIGQEGSSPEELTAVGGKLYFRAIDTTAGAELFEFDPILGVRLAWELKTAAGQSSYPEFLAELDGMLYFQPTGDQISGLDIWQFDPVTGMGQVMLDLPASASYPSYLTSTGGKLFFTGTTTGLRKDIYQYDPIQSELIKLLDPVRTRSGDPSQLTVLDGILYFEAFTTDQRRQLWKYDPQANSGQGALTSITGGTSVIDSYIYEMTELDGALYFRLLYPLDEFRLYRYVPGSVNGPQQVLSLPIEYDAPYTYQVMASGDRLYFVIDDGLHGYEVWEYNPNAAPEYPSARRITNFNETETNANIELQFSHDGKLYFIAGSSNRQLYCYDPAANDGAGGVMLVDDLSTYQLSKAAVHEDIFYVQQGNDLYRYDINSIEEPNEPVLLGRLLGVDIASESMVTLGNKIYFAARARTGNSAKLYQIDPNASSNALTDMGIGGINPFGRESIMLVANIDRLMFSRSWSAGDYYAELWELFPEDLGGDGVPRRVTTINRDGWAAPFELTQIEDDLYFIAYDDDSGQEIFVVPFNPAPITQGETYETNEDVELVIDTTSLLDNDFDPEGQTLTTSIEIAPARGTLTLNPDGTFRYLPQPNYFGTDQFTYLVTDEGGTSKTAQVQITIHPQPDPATIEGNLTTVTHEDNQSQSSGFLTVVDPDVGEAAFQANTNVQGTYGVFSIQANGFWTYRVNNALVQSLAAGASVSDVFQVTSFDTTASETFTVTIEGRNDAPTLGGTSTGTTSEESTDLVSGTLAISDTDQGESFFIPRTSVPGTYGTFSVTALGNWTYQLDNSKVQHVGQGDSVQDTFSVSVLDQSASIDVHVTINGENDEPSTTIHAIEGFHVEQQLIHIPVSATDIDTNNSQFTYAYQVIRVSDQQVVDSGTATNVTLITVAVPTSGQYRVELTTTDAHSGQGTAQATFTVGPQSTVELSISRDQNAVPGSLSASPESDLHIHEWEEVAGHLWFNVEEGLPNHPFDVTFELTSSDAWLGDPEVLAHLGTQLQWNADGGVFTGTLSDVDLTGYQVGERVLLATLRLPKDLQNPVGLAMDSQGAYPQTTMQTGISLTAARADVLHPFAIQTTHNAEFRPVVYDANDDGRVGLTDFVQFIDNYGRTAGESTPDAYRFDYDGSGRVGIGDFVLFLQHYGTRKSDDHPIHMPIFDPPQPPPVKPQSLLEGEPVQRLPEAIVVPRTGPSEATTQMPGSSLSEALNAPDANVPPPSETLEENATIDARLIDAIFQAEEDEPLDDAPQWDDHVDQLITSKALEDSLF